MKKYESSVIVEMTNYKDNYCDRDSYPQDHEPNGLAYDTLCELEDSIEALEVKNVDLKKEIDILVNAFYSIKKLATDKESLLGEKMTDEEVFNEIRAKCNDAISYIKRFF